MVVVIAFTAEAAEAVLLSVILFGFYRRYSREYLRQWGWSWVAAGGYFLGKAFELSPMATWLPWSPVQLVISGGALVLGYWQLGWLFAGHL